MSSAQNSAPQGVSDRMPDVAGFEQPNEDDDVLAGEWRMTYEDYEDYKDPSKWRRALMFDWNS